jgi:hypothetical protein
MIVDTHKAFQGKMPLIPIRLKELTPTSGKNSKGKEIQRTPGYGMNLIGKENERAKDSHGE